jgi:hypothetical protein
LIGAINGDDQEDTHSQSDQFVGIEDQGVVRLASAAEPVSEEKNQDEKYACKDGFRLHGFMLQMLLFDTKDPLITFGTGTKIHKGS